MLAPYPHAGSNKCLHHHFLNPDPGMVFESPVTCQTKIPKRVQGFGVHRSGLYGVNIGICFGHIDPELTVCIVADILNLSLDSLCQV